jgi:membrane associated rhomboid family serine protease
VFPLKDNIPTERFPVVTVALIALNVLAYFFFQHGTISLGDPTGADYLQNLFDYAWIPVELTDGVQCVPDQAFQAVECTAGVADQPPVYVTVFTAMFMHGGLLHLGGNMLFLWIFGDNVEHRIGHLNFLFFYLILGVVASLAQILVAPDSIIPTLGASGAISGILGAYLVLFPGNRVLVILLRFPIWVPAIVAIGMWAVLQVISGVASLGNAGEAGGVAYMAHIGGFFAGIVGGFAIRTLLRETRHERGTPLTPFG